MKRVLILGAAGRDFHNFNVYYKKNKDYKVVGFTATQLPNITNRAYPQELAGKRYPKKGIPIYPEEKMQEIIRKKKVDEVAFSYSDVPYSHVMETAAKAQAAGASFKLLGPKETMLKSKKRVIAVTAARTGSGKSQVTRKICRLLESYGKKVVVIRHPMPYGDLKKQAVQRFETMEELELADATIEEREEYEPHVTEGRIVYAGVDYKKILKQAEKEAEYIVWDGGNNDFPFIKPDIMFTLIDPLRAGDEKNYYPGETCVRMADAIIITKENTAKKRDIKTVKKNAKELNPKAPLINANSIVDVDDPTLIHHKKVLVVEDGPSITHGELPYGTGYLAAKKYGAKIINPKKKVVGSIKKAYKKYKHIGPVIPAMGYGREQLAELEESINRIDCQAIITGTPVDLKNLIWFDQPVARARYDVKEIGRPTIKEIIESRWKLTRKAPSS